MIGSVLAADTGAGSLGPQAARGGGMSGAFADAMRRAEGAGRGEVGPKGSVEDSGEVRDRLWDERIEQQRVNREDPERFERAQKGAEQLVSATFIVPILQQLRESSTAEAPFGPGMYEKRLGPMLDAQIADRIVSAQRLPIVEAVRDRMLGRMDSRVESGSESGLEPEDRAEGTS